jgi:hypothetical protein
VGRRQFLRLRIIHLPPQIFRHGPVLVRRQEDGLGMPGFSWPSLVPAWCSSITARSKTSIRAGR